MSVSVDTNVVSELIRKSPHPSVKACADGLNVEKMFLSSISEAELRFGTAILPLGRRREMLILEIENMLRDVFENRVLPFDSEAARQYAIIAANRHFAGYSVALADCQTAAMARSQGMTVATRNVRDFEKSDVKVVNPWKAV